jgi:hypothetical protein
MFQLTQAYIPPYESGLTPGGYESLKMSAEEGLGRQAARQQAAREQAEREAAAQNTASQPGGVTTSSPPTAAGRVSLVSADIAVQGGRMSVVRLTCYGFALCDGKLTLSAKLPAGSRAKGRTRTVTVGSASFSVPGDETKTVKIDIDAAGRGLLDADRGRLNASLAILELPPSPENTLMETVRLINQKTHVKQGKR